MHTEANVEEKAPMVDSSLCSKYRMFERARWSSVMLWALALGLFIQMSGKVWIVSGSARNTQIYFWLLLPALIFSLHKILFKRDVKIDIQYWPWMLFLGWVALSVSWGNGSEDGASLAKRGLFIGLYLVAVNLLINRKEVLFRRALYAAVLIIAIGALMSLIYQYGVLHKPMGYRTFRIDRMGFGDLANYGWPVAAGIFNGAVAVWALGLAIDKRVGIKVSLCWMAVFAILALYVLMTGTRGAWFALVGGGLVSVVMQRSKRGYWGLGVSLVLALAVLFVLWDQVIIDVQRRQLSGRSGIWEYYLSVMPGYWLSGHGLGTPFVYHWPDGRSVSPHAHSLYLQQVYDSGLVSLGLMLVGLAGIFYKAWTLRNNPWICVALPALVFALISMLTDVERIFTRPSDYWTVFWLPVAVLLALPSRQSN